MFASSSPDCPAPDELNVCVKCASYVAGGRGRRRRDVLGLLDHPELRVGARRAVRRLRPSSCRPAAWRRADTSPLDSSIFVPAAGATVPASSDHLTPVTPAGLAAAVMLVPDSSGIVAFCGATVTPEIGLSASVVAGEHPGRDRPADRLVTRRLLEREDRRLAHPERRRRRRASSPAGWRADAPSADTTGAIRPSAIARPTAWFPAVICIDRRTSSDIGTPLIPAPRRSGRRRRAGSRGRRGWTSPPTASRPAPRRRSGCARSAPASMPRRLARATRRRSGIRHTHSPCSAATYRFEPMIAAPLGDASDVAHVTFGFVKRAARRGPDALDLGPAVVAPAPDQVDLVARVLAELARPQPPARGPRRAPARCGARATTRATPADAVRVHAQDLAVERRRGPARQRVLPASPTPA